MRSTPAPPVLAGPWLVTSILGAAPQSDVPLGLGAITPVKFWLGASAKLCPVVPAKLAPVAAAKFAAALAFEFRPLLPAALRPVGLAEAPIKCAGAAACVLVTATARP